MGFIKRYVCELVLVINLFIIPLNHDWNNWCNRPVINDAFGYYAYLPAVILYQDLHYDFMAEIWPKYYKDIGTYDTKGGFIVKQHGQEVNKYPPGVAYFQAPFFIACHAVAKLFGQPADGYSTIYMFFICIGAVFWQYIFFIVLRKIFRFYNLSDFAFFWTVILLSFGTNLFFYTQKFAAYSHLYSMLSITCFFYGGLRFFSSERYTENNRYFLLMCVSFAMAVITRNMNGLCILLLPCMGFKFSNFKEYLGYLKTLPAILSLVFSFSILFSMLLFWYLQTGHWLIDSYPGEYFNWASPKIFRSLFSAHKGWFFYTPIAFIALLGLFYMPRITKWNFFLVLSLIVYIASAWYAWDYGTGFSLRAYIDWYLFVGVGLGFLIHNLNKKILYPVLGFCILFSFINQLWTAQFMRGIISGSSQGIEHFAQDFFRLRYIADFKVSKKTVLKHKGLKNSFDKIDHTFVDGKIQFSEGIRTTLPRFLKNSAEGRVQYGADINVAEKKDNIFICASVTNEKDSIIYWAQHSIFSFIYPGEWQKVEAGFVFPDNLPRGLKINIFFWEPEGKTICKIDNMYLNFYNVAPE